MDKYLIDSHKIHYHMDRVNQMKSDPLNTYPLYIEISPVGFCNHRCKFCAVDYLGYKHTKLESKQLIQFLKDAKNLGVRSVMFAGEGEPLLHKDLATIICLCVEIGLDVALTTNGVLLTDRFVKCCLHAIKWIKVSINAGKPSSYALMHGTKVDDYHTVWRNLDFACDYKKMFKVPCAIGAQTILLPENADEIHDIAFYSKLYGLDYLVVKPYSHNPDSITSMYENINYSDTEFMEDIVKAYEYDNFSVIWRKKTAVNLDKEKSYKYCMSVPFLWAYLKSTGDLYGCSAHMTDERFNYGNINSNSFKEIWTSPKRQQAIELMKSFDVSNCRKNCRMEHVNRFLWEMENASEHRNFI
jgi:GTP 3',8-cyclase